MDRPKILRIPTYMELEKGVMYRVPPIGKPIFNTEVYVLSAEQKNGSNWCSW